MSIGGTERTVEVNGVKLTETQITNAAKALGLAVGPIKEREEMVEGEALFSETGSCYIPLNPREVMKYCEAAIKDHTVFGVWVYPTGGKLHISSHLINGVNGRPIYQPGRTFKYKLKAEKVL